MKVISASRRTDLVAFFPEWLSSVLDKERAYVRGPSGHVFSADLNPERVHTLVLWSKNFQNLIDNRFNLKNLLKRYSQLYFHFTLTGLGGTLAEEGVPEPTSTFPQLEMLVEIAGLARRVSVRFDPIVFWREGRRIRTNLYYFEKLAPKLASIGIEDIRFSFAQWYRKAKRRAFKHGFIYLDPPQEEKLEHARYLTRVARAWGLKLYACSQEFLTAVEGVEASSCIDGRLFQRLHPSRAPASHKKDESQRKECRCTESIDIGSYTQKCPHRCIYCYAN